MDFIQWPRPASCVQNTSSYFAEILHLSCYIPATDVLYFQYGSIVHVTMSGELFK